MKALIVVFSGSLLLQPTTADCDRSSSLDGRYTLNVSTERKDIYWANGTAVLSCGAVSQSYVTSNRVLTIESGEVIKVNGVSWERFVTTKTETQARHYDKNLGVTIVAKYGPGPKRGGSTGVLFVSRQHASGEHICLDAYAMEGSHTPPKRTGRD